MSCPGPYEGRRIEAVDPGGAVSSVYPTRARDRMRRLPGSRRIEAPGVIRHVEGTRFSIGKPSGEVSERCLRFSDAMVAGISNALWKEISAEDIWIKLMGNVVSIQ